MPDWFRMGGFGMFPTLFFGVVAILAAARYAQKPEKRFFPVVAALSAVTLLSGGLGFVTGLINSCLAIQSVTPDLRYIVVIGLGESLANVSLALALLVVASLGVLAGTIRYSRSTIPANSL